MQTVQPDRTKTRTDRPVRDTCRTQARNDGWALAPLKAALAISLIATSITPHSAQGQISFNRPTYSSPIAISRTDRQIWCVNPSDDSVSVFCLLNNTRLSRIQVGDEPQSVALTPDGQYAYVANAASGTVTIIRIDDPACGTFSTTVVGTLTTGAEPWNIVTSPDGLRVFVANSGQDTITVINAATRAIIGHVNVRKANDPDLSRPVQPRGLAVTADNKKLYVTRFLSLTKIGGRQGDDFGKEGLVAVLNIDTTSTSISAYNVARLITLAPQITGFTFPGLTNDTAAFPNQLQSIVIRGDRAYLPNIAASPSGPLRFDLDTHAFVNQIGAVNGTSPTDLGALNLHLGARDPEPGKRTNFFANPWAIAFTTNSGAANAYAVSAGSDLLVKLNVDSDGNLSFTGDTNTTRYIDLNDPTNPATSGANAGKNPIGIAINSTGTVAYVANFVSRNVSVVNLVSDSVVAVMPSFDLPIPGSQAETNLVGAEVFFSSRGNFDSIPGTNSLRDRLSSQGWQSCASCHFRGLTDGVVWQFPTGPRKTLPLNSSFNPQDRRHQRVLNYSANFDEIEDFEWNIRNISGPGPLADGTLDPNHGLLIGDNGDLNVAPGAVEPFEPPNANRPQLTVTPPNSTHKVRALYALREWVRFAVRTPNAPTAGLPNAPSTSGTVLIPANSVWKFLDNGSDQGTAWRAPAFNDAEWASGPGKLGYGDGGEATTVSFGPDAGNKYITTYFRRSFQVPRASLTSAAVLRVLRDDGVAVYLNGVEVFRSNLPEGQIAFRTLASSSIDGGDENAYVEAVIPTSALVVGINVIAAEVHQVHPANSDMGFDLALFSSDVVTGRALFAQAGCTRCHGGPDWTISLKAFTDFTSPPLPSEVFTERTGAFTGDPVGTPFLARFLRDIGSFNLGVPGQGNPLGNNIGADEKAAPVVEDGELKPAQDALGRDYNGDFKGNGFNVPSLLGLHMLPPYMHNGAAESLDAVVADVKHRTANGLLPDVLSNPVDQAKVTAFLQTIDANTALLPALFIDWFTVDGGGRTSANSTFTVIGTVGQPDAGELSGGRLAIAGGFWGVIAPVQMAGAPLLTIKRTEMNTVEVSWPSPSTGFLLQQNTDLNTTSWINAPEAVNDNGTIKFIVVNPPVGNRFYRLLKP